LFTTLFSWQATIEELNLIELLIIPVPFMPREQVSWAAGQPSPNGMLLLFAHDKALRMIFTLRKLCRARTHAIPRQKPRQGYMKIHGAKRTSRKQKDVLPIAAVL